MLESAYVRPPWRALFGVTLFVACAFGLLTVVAAVLAGLPIRDPDGLFGPSYVRLPLIVGGMIAADVLPRAVRLRRSAAGTGLRAAVREVVRTRWPGTRFAAVAAGLASFYLAYVAYRNLKSFLPFLRKDLTDRELVASDFWLTGGHHPGELLHQLLGTGIAAEVLSFTYVFFLFFVPFSLAAALVWSNDLGRGAWYVNALSFNWIIGTFTYYALPSLGPVYVERFRFEDLPRTEVSRLQEALLSNRVDVLANPHATQSVHGIAAFASLHTSIVFTAALVAHLIGLPRVVRWAMWVFTFLTALATVYFGWHYLLDVVAGLGVGALSVWLGAKALRLRRNPPVPAPRTGEPALVGTQPATTDA